MYHCATGSLSFHHCITGSPFLVHHYINGDSCTGVPPYYRTPVLAYYCTIGTPILVYQCTTEPLSWYITVPLGPYSNTPLYYRSLFLVHHCATGSLSWHTTVLPNPCPGTPLNHGPPTYHTTVVQRLQSETGPGSTVVWDGPTPWWRSLETTGHGRG